MASVPTLPLVPVEEYLESSYERDMEYVDGVLVERSMPSYAHGLLQALLILWFGQFQKQFGFVTIPELRVETVGNRRYRIPDITLLRPQALATRALQQTPLAVIEIWSRNDRLPYQTRRYREFWEKGVREIIVLDPELRTAFRWVEKALIEGPVNDGIQFPDGALVPFSSDELFAQLAQAGEQPQQP